MLPPPPMCVHFFAQSGANADKLTREECLNSPGDTVSSSRHPQGAQLLLRMNNLLHPF